MEAPAASSQPRRASSSSGSGSPLGGTTTASSSSSSSSSTASLLSATTNAGASVLAGPAPSAKQEPPQVDAWIVQKLKNDWSSSEFGGLLSKDKLSDAVTSFRHLDTAIKVRFLLSFLSMRRDVVDESKFAIVEIIDAAENDTEEWVKVGAGIVKQYMFMSEDGAESGDTFFHEQITSTTARVLDAVKTPARGAATDDFFSHDSAFLNASVRPEAPAPLTQHFTVVEAASARASSSATASASTANGKSDDKSAERKSVSHRPPMARPALHAASSASSGSASGASTRLTPTTSKPPPPARKHVPEMSEIRRKADAGRFKRQRSRISMIDIDEVKQIEVEKALKAEERKKQKLVAAAKEKSAASASSSGTGAAAAGGASGSDKATGASGRSGDATGDDESAPLAASQHDEDDDDDEDDHLHPDEDDDDDDSGAGAGVGIGLNGTSGDVQQQQQHQQQHHLHHLLHRSTSDDDRSDYGVGDGTQALLNAAIMAEGVNQQAPAYQQQQQQQHALSHAFHYDHDPQPVVAQTYHRGFEPEDASQHLSAFSYGFGSAWGDQSYAPPPLQQQQPPPPYQPLPHLQQYSTGFMDDPSALHPGQVRHPSGFDSASHTGTSNSNGGNGSGSNGNYLDGPPDYWR